MNDVLTISRAEHEAQSAEELEISLLANAALLYRERVGKTFMDFVRAVAPLHPRYPDYLSFKHIAAMIDVLDRVARDELDHVMFWLPPQYFKSSIVSRLFSAYYLFKHPERWVGLGSYSADIAQMMSRGAQDYYVRSGMKMDDNVQATKEWMTRTGGGMWATGIGGPMAGKPGYLGIIDDYFKNRDEAMSVRIRENRIDWLRSIWSGRNFKQEIIVTTRWHEGDPCGYLLDEERENPKGWHVFVFDAIKEKDSVVVPGTCVVEPDWREPGEVLCEQIHDASQLEAKRKDAGELFWSCLWQQRPTMMKGNLWKASWFLDPNNQFDVLPEGCVNDGYDWDTAQTDDEQNAANAYVRSVVKRGDDKTRDVMYVTEVDWAWFEFPEQVSWMRTKTNAPHYVEDKSSGKDVVSTLKSEGIAAKEVPVKGDKESRTALVLHFAEQGRVKIARHLVDKLLNDGKQGILAFPRGKHRDVNDALVQATNRQLVRDNKVSILGAW